MNNKNNSSERYSTYKFTCKERFLKYVKYDTQSDDSSTSIPSTEKQKTLLKELLLELKKLGVQSEMDIKGFVYAQIKSNTKKKVPKIGFLSHVDTSPEVSGANVKPTIHKNYSGGNIKLPKDNQTISPKQNHVLKDMIGHDIITSDGSTLLGADDKAGVAVMMDAAEYMMKHPDFKHGDVMLGFTIDEEVGTGIDSFDVKKFGAEFAYTVDGETPGEIEAENFNADKVEITINGNSTHTGYAKNKLINSARIASEFIEKFPKDKWSPETTEEKEGFVHIMSVNGGTEKKEIKILIRDFEEKKLTEYENRIKKMLETIIKNYPGASHEFKVITQYRNMKDIIDKSPQVLKYAIEAVKRLGIKPIMKIIRGGTDGSKISFMGVPTPNISCGEHNFHSRAEFVSVQDMESSVKTILEICSVWEEKSKKKVYK